MQWVDTLTRLIRKADKVGYLYKRGDKFSSTWRHRWFVLKGNQLLYYENEVGGSASVNISTLRQRLPLLTLIISSTPLWLLPFGHLCTELPSCQERR